MRRGYKPDIDPSLVPIMSPKELGDDFQSASEIIKSKFRDQDPKWAVRLLLDRIEFAAIGKASPEKLDITLDDFGAPITAHYRRREMHIAPGKGSSPAWYYDKASQDAIIQILENTITTKPGDLFRYSADRTDLIGNDLITSRLEKTVIFNTPHAGSLDPQILSSIWQELEDKAQKAHREKFGKIAEERYKEISGFSCKPKDWPESDAVNVEVDGRSIKMTFAGSMLKMGAGEWNINESSLPDLANIYTNRAKEQKETKLYNQDQAAAEIGINRLAKKDSTHAVHYKEIKRIFAGLRAEAGKIGEAETIATVEFEGREYVMQKPEGIKSWFLSGESIDTLRQALGLAPKIGDDVREENTSGVAAWTDRAKKGTGWHRE